MSDALSAYVLCGTPRSGSTLLCEMLTATGVAGRPHSYFRQEDFQGWAKEWGVPFTNGIDTPDFDRAYLEAMKREASAGTGICGLRLMWESVAEATKRLNRALGREADLAQSVETAFGPTLYVHVSRRDKVAQAVSLLRAKQSGLWHLAADGSVLEGAETMRPMYYDRMCIATILKSLQSGDESWNAFFDKRGIAPLRLIYETVVDDPNAALQDILMALGIDPIAARQVKVHTAKLADAESAHWVERFHMEAGS